MDRKMPSAIESEEQVLGSMLLGREYTASACERLREDDFYSSAHRFLFAAMRDMLGTGEAVDPVTIMQEMRRRGAAAEELLRVTDLAREVITPVGMHTHIRRVQDAATLRALIRAGSEVVELGFDRDADVRSVAARAEEIVFQATERSSRGEIASWTGATQGALDRLEYMSSVDNPVTGVPMGLDQVDYQLYGLQQGMVYLVAARPSVGKTAFLTGAALRAAQAGHRVAFFSLEMSAEEIADRMIHMLSGIAKNRFRSKRVTEQDWIAVVKAAEEVAGLPIEVFDSGVQTPLDMAMKLRRMPKLDLVVLDYVQLARHHKRTSSKNEEVTEISRALKLTARELFVPVLAAAQLNREVESRKGPPRLSDLRDSGALEQDADVVMFLHRDDEHQPSGRMKRIELLCEKNRHGPTFRQWLTFEQDIVRLREQTLGEEIAARQSA